MFNCMKSSSNVRVKFLKKCSLSKHETRPIVSECSSLMELNQINVTNEDQAISNECTKIVLRSALKKSKSKDENNLENIERVPKKVTFLLDEEYKRKDRKKSKLHKKSSTKQMNLDDGTDYSNDISMDEIVGPCKRNIDSTCSKTKLSSPPMSTYPSLDSLESIEDDTKVKGLEDLSNEFKENGTFLNSVLKISSTNKKIMKYIYTKVKNLSKPSTSKTSDNEKSEQAEEIEISKTTDDHNDTDTFHDEKFINHIEYDEPENPDNTTTANTTTANTTTANTTTANTTTANTTLANTTLANTTLANTTLANTTLANTTLANTTLANTTLANTTLANTTTDDTTLANTTTDDTTTNDTTTNDTTTNDTTTNDTTTNDTTTNDTTTNDTTTNDTTADDTTTNDTTADDTTADDTTADDTTADDTTADDTTADDTTADNTSAVGELLFGVNLTHGMTFNDIYELCQKEKCSSSQNY